MSRICTLPYVVSKQRAVETKRHHDMNSVVHASAHQIYPKRYFSASPTWLHWNKLTAADVHALRTERGFEGQKVYFYANHPIKFVRVVGLLLEIEQIAEGKYTLLTLDDGSGECIVVKIKRREQADDGNGPPPSNTEVDNVSVHVDLGLPMLFLEKKPVELGSVVKVKGTIDTFRDVRQLELQRLFTVKDTNMEAKAWSEVAQWKRDILSRPWVLSQAERDAVDEKSRVDERKERERAKRKRELSGRVSDKKRRHDEKRECRRKKEEARYDAGALKGSNAIPMPWE